MYTYTEITVTVKGIEVELLAEGHVVTGGSNSYGSDEPAWCEVEDVALSHTDGRKLRKDTDALIWKDHSDVISEQLIESVD